MILPDRVVDADMFELAEAIILVDLDDGEWAYELVGAPHVFYEYGLCASCDADAPLPGLEKFLGGRCFV